MDNQLESRIRSRITLEQKTDAPVVSSIEDRITQRLKDQQEAERAAIQRSLTLSIDKDPNQLAQVNRIAKESGIDRETVEANAAMFLQRQKERGILSASERSPALSKNYADPNFAGLAKDDADNLSSISDYVGAFTSYMVGARRGGGLPQDLAAIYYGTKQSSESLGRMALEPIGRAGRALGFEDNIFEKVAQDYANMAKATEEGYKKIAPLPDTFWERSVRSGVQSGAQMVKYIPLAFLGPPGWQTALTMMSTEAASNTYQQDREKGVDIGRSLNHAALDGIAEYTMERYLGFAGFAKNLLAGQSATKLLAYEIFREIPGEMGTTLWQNFNEWAIVNPQKSLSQFLAEQPEALAETAVATIFGGAIQTGAGRSSLKLIESIQGQQLEATEALQRAEALQQALQTAMNTKLAQLSPEDFTRVVNEMGENAPVRFDARLLADVFAQSGIEAQELQQRLPSAFEQLQEGTIDNREVSIPVGEFISGVMNTPLQEQLQDYARLGDSEYSKAEAQEAMKTAGEFLANEADRVLKQAQDQQAWQESTDEVKSAILKQLNDVGTFKPDVNEWFATMQGAFFSTMAERTGVTPKEFYQQFSLKIQQAAQVEITGNTEEERLLDAIKKASQGFRSVEDATAAMIDFGHAVYRVVPGQAPVLITDAAQLQTIPLKELRMIERSMLDDQGNVYAQSEQVQKPRLLAVHGIAEDSLQFADKMGGLPVPSIGVITEDVGAVEGFGEITLIGKPELGDPTKEPVFSADAYTIRFPKPEWNKVKPKEAIDLMRQLQPFDREFDDNIADRTYDQMANKPNANELVNGWLSSTAARAMFLRERGMNVAPVMMSRRMQTDIPAEKIEEIRPFYEAVDSSGGAAATIESPEFKALEEKYKQIVREYYSAKGLPKSLVDKFVGGFGFGTFDRLGRDIQSAGQQVLDRYETSKAIDAMLEPIKVEYKAWVEDKVVSKFSDPFLRVAGKKVPYTLPNIAKVMAREAKRGAEKTMTYGTGQVRAASTVQFSDVEQMRQAAKTAIVDLEEYKKARSATDETLSNYREMMLEQEFKDGDTWEQLDASMRALARWSTGKQKTPASMRAAMKREGFLAADTISDDDIDFAIQAANDLLNAPVPYFEAKPDRIVTLDEFAGAVVPDTASQQTLDILQKYGIQVRTYNDNIDGDRDLAIRALSEGIESTGIQVFFQMPSVAGVRGTFNPQKMLIELTQSADLSTFIHESGHFFLEVMVDLASRPNAPQNVIDDVGTVMAWFGMDMNTWKGLTVEQKRKHHEMFAESFERYMFDGKAPTPELQPMFRTFSSWLKRVYRAIKDIISGRGRQLPEEIRQVFDRMLATEEQIADAERLAGLMPNQEATDVAIEELQARSLKDLKWAANAQSKLIKKMQREATELRKGVENEVRERVALMPIYRAMRWIRTGEMVDLETGDTVKATQGYKLSTEAIEQMFPETMLARPDLTKLRGMTSKEGLHPDLVADMFGFVNGDILVRELIVATPQKEMVDGMTTEEMLNRYGDITSPEALKMAAMEAVHNEVRARALATELKAQEDALAGTTDTGRKNVRGRAITVNSLMQAAKLFADNVTSRTPARLLKREIQNHRRAELRASKEWAAATKKGETKKAIQAKRDQLLNHYTVKAMQDAQAEIQKAMAFFKTVNRGNNETLVKRGRDPDVVNAARAILAQYGLAPAQGKKADEYMELVKTNDPTMYASLKPAMDAAIADAKPIDQLTVQEIKALADEVGAFWHMSKRSRKMEVDGDLIDIQEAEEMLVARMDEIGVPASMPGETQALTKKDEAKRKLQFAGALLRRMEQWVEGMDGKYGGPFTKLIFEPVKKAADNYRQARVVARKQYAELVKGLQPVMEAKLISAPELNYTFGKSANSNGVGMAELLHAIIHTGNQSNKRKMLLGRGWATENDDGTLDTTKWDSFIDRIIREGTLKKEHYDFAQGVWDLLEGMKAGAQKTHREVFGRYFDEVTADAFVTPFGTYRGGYAPAQVDSRLVTDAAIRELAEAENESMAFSFPTTNRGFTKGRTEYNRPLLLDLRALNQHIDKVLLFTHMEPAVRDVNRLLRRSGINKPLSRLQPAAYDGMLIPWLNRAAKQQVETPVAGDGSLNRILSVARTRAGMSLMFANISNTFQQITGLSNAAVVVKASHLKRATAQYIKAPRELAESVATASIFMNDRMKNEIAAINNSMEEILINPTTYQRAQTWSNRHAYFLQAAFDNVIGPIVWTGAYNQAIEEGMKDEQAVKFADSAVRKTQGSTLPEDISRIESGPAYARLFTQFVGYFNMIANTNGTALKNLVKDVGIKKGAGKAFYVLLMGVLIPAWVAEAIALAMRGGPEDEDDDGYLDDWLSSVLGMGTLKFALAGIPFLGQGINAGINRFNSNPTDDRIAASPAVSLIESSVAAPYSVYKAILDDGSAATAVRDVSTLMSVLTGLPIRGVARPVIYGVGVMEGRIEPEGPTDMIRGLLTGTASPESRVP